METKHTTLAQCLEPDQVGETRGDKTADNDVPCENHGCHNTLEETVNHVSKCGDSTDAQDLTSSRTSSPSISYAKPDARDADQDGDTELVHTGDEAVDNSTPCESNGCQDNLEEETVSCAKKDVPDAGNQVTGDGDSTETQDLTGSRTPLTNLGEETHHTPDATRAQDTPRSQQTTLGKPSTRLENPDTAFNTIRSAPVLPEEHCSGCKLPKLSGNSYFFQTSEYRDS